MGLYVNPGNSVFKEIVSSEIYVDKTMLLAELNKTIGTESKFLAVSRPHQFGKTMAESMIAAYYSRDCHSAELFKDFKIAGDPSFAKHLNKYNVLHLDINRFWLQYDRDAISKMQDMVKDDFIETFSGVDFEADWEISDYVTGVCRHTKTPFVVIFDDYDVLFRDEYVLPDLLSSYLKFLNDFFNSKDVSSCIALAYITGLFPIIRDEAQSKLEGASKNLKVRFCQTPFWLEKNRKPSITTGIPASFGGSPSQNSADAPEQQVFRAPLNNFKEITFLNPGRFADFTGFTEDEVKGLCDRHSMNFSECQSWYGGYRFHGRDIYAPMSVVCAVKEGSCKPYWNQTYGFRAVRDVVILGFDGMREDIERMISGESIPLDVNGFENDPFKISSKDDAFTYLCHLGCLTYSAEDGTCRIPNREVRGEWVKAIEGLPDYSSILSMIRASKSLLESAWSGDAKAVASALGLAHEKLTSPLSYDNEKSLQSAIRLAFFYADCYYTIVSEFPAGKGYADLVFIPYKPNVPAMVVELKAKGAAQSAFDQIRSKRYFAGLDKYEGNLLLVGVSYDKTTKKHECVIEKR